MIPQQNQNDGSKYGAEPEKDRAKRTKDILFKDVSVNVDFMFAYKVNLAPMITRRSLFAEVGGFNHNFSCPGQPGIGLDFELSIRMWRLGRSVGLYDSKFKHAWPAKLKIFWHSLWHRKDQTQSERVTE